MPRLLVDMSSALWERAGIPQVARQMAWMFAQSKEVSTSTLFLSLHEKSRADNYSKQRKGPLSVRDDAEYLADLFGDFSTYRVDFLLFAQRILRRILDGAYPIVPFQPGLFSDAIWDNYFVNGLPPQCRKLLSKLALQRSPLTRAETLSRLRWKLPLARLETSQFDFAIFQNPTPIKVSPGTTKIVRLHDLVPIFRYDTQPQVGYLMKDFYETLSHCVKDSYFVCVSESTQDELLSIFPKARTSVIPISIILPTFRSNRPAATDNEDAYFLAVGTIEPRKNYRRLFQAFRTYRESQTHPRNLVLVGGQGWNNKDVMKDIQAAKREGWLTWHPQRSPDQLIDLYQGAYAQISSSVHEGFGIPPVEAASFGIPSVLSSLRVFRDRFGSSAEYFDPYDPMSLADALGRMTPSRRSELAIEVALIAQQFQVDKEMPKWLQLFDQLSRK